MVESYLILKRVMQILHMNKSSIVRLIQHGWLSPIKRGDRLLFQTTQVAWIKRALEQDEQLETVSTLIDLTELPTDHEFPVSKLPAPIAQNYQIVPIAMEGDTLVIGCADPSSSGLVEELTTILKLRVRLARVEPDQLRRHMELLYAANETRILKPLRIHVSDDQDEVAPDLIEGRAEGVRRWYAEDDNTPRVFIAMPFDPKFDQVHKAIYEAIEHCGGRSLRIDQVPNLRNIWLAIENEIARCDILIADFTGDVDISVANPNVVTEATIAFYKYQTPVVICTQSTNALFFDWKHHFANVYEDTQNGRVRLYQSLVGRLTAEFCCIKPITD